MSSSNCCFLTCIQISQEAGQVVWCSHLFQNFPQFIVIHTVKDFGIVNKAEVKSFSCVQLLATPWTIAYQAPQSMGFFQARILGLPFPSPPQYIMYKEKHVLNNSFVCGLWVSGNPYKQEKYVNIYLHIQIEKTWEDLHTKS